MPPAKSKDEVSTPKSPGAFKSNWKRTEHVTDEFLDKVVEISEKLGIDPEHLMEVMATESGLNPAKWNGTTAVGLIQFTKVSIDEINRRYPPENEQEKLTKDKLAGMSSVDQLEYVYRHLEVKKGKMKDALDVYTTTFAPYAKVIGKDDLMDPIYEGGTPAYKDNAGLDNDKDGNLTKNDLRLQIEKLAGAYRE